MRSGPGVRPGFVTCTSPKGSDIRIADPRRDADSIGAVRKRLLTFTPLTGRRTRRKKLLGLVKLSENSTRFLATPCARGRGSVYIYTHTRRAPVGPPSRRPLETDARVERAGLYSYMKETKVKRVESRPLAGVTLTRKIKRSHCYYLLRTVIRTVIRPVILNSAVGGTLVF